MSDSIPVCSAAPHPAAQGDDALLLSSPEPANLAVQPPLTKQYFLKSGGNSTISPAVQKRARRKVKPPKDSKIYKSVLAIIALRRSGASAQDISDQLGLTKHTIRAYLYYSNKRGWLLEQDLDDPNDKLEYVLAGKAVRNLSEFLDQKNENVSLEVAKGLGLLPGPKVLNQPVTTMGMALRIVVEAPPAPISGIAIPQIREGSIGGTPAFDAEVIE